MNGFFVTISNDLLEDKHFEKMGNAVWLYMWLIDKMTEISEGIGIVNGGYPVTHAAVQENFSTMNDRQYRRYIRTLREAGYINTVKARYGLYITVNKPKKHFNKKVVKPAVKTRPDKKDLTELKPVVRPDKNGRAVRTNMADRPDKNGLSLYKEDNNNNNTINNTNIGDQKSPAKKHKELVSKLYYEAIKALDLPVTNHNTLRTKINEMAQDKDKDKIINYLKFMRDQFAATEWAYKPNITEALQIYSKRAKIRETFRAHVTGGQTKRGVRL